MEQKWSKKLISGFSLFIAVCLLAGAITLFYRLMHIRPLPYENLRPIFQSDEVWCSEDAKIQFRANHGLAAEGIICDGTSNIKVEVTVDIDAYCVFVYVPAYLDDGTPIHDPSLDLEEWEYRSKGEDWFVVEVIKSTYYKSGDMITFYMQKDQTG